jgi:hypothetical protein
MSGSFIYVGASQVVVGTSPLTLGDPADPTTTPGGIAYEVEPGAVWTWAYGPGASATTPGATRELTQAKGRVVTWRVDGHAFAQFSIDGASDEAASIVERRDDLWVYRNGVLVFRGRIYGVDDDIGATQHHAQFLAVDYRGMLTLAAKVEPPVPTFSDVDQAQIVWQLIEDWQALDGGDWGITEGVGTTSGTNRDETDITAFSPVGEVIDRLLRRDGGGEWEISPQMELNRFWPERGTDTGVVLDHGGALAHVGKSTAEFGNVGGATGNDATTPEAVEAAGVASDQRGRWTVAQAFPTVSRQATVTAKAQWLADQASTIEDEWRATFRARGWGGPADVWIGDRVEFRVSSGRVSVAGTHRVVELQAVCGEDGEETISVGLVGVAA